MLGFTQGLLYAPQLRTTPAYVERPGCGHDIVEVDPIRSDAMSDVDKKITERYDESQSLRHSQQVKHGEGLTEMFIPDFSSNGSIIHCLSG